MSSQVIGSSKALVTNVAFVRFLSSVGVHVLLQDMCTSERLLTDTTNKRALSCVTPLARRVKVAPVCDQPQPRQAPPGRWGCEAAG